MNDFQLSPELDRNKVFLIKRSELEGRFDPVIALYQKKTTQFKFQTEYLSSLLKGKPQYGANEVGINRFSEEQPRYIRITDIDEYGLLKQEIGKTAKNIESKFLLKNDDLLFARSGATVGKAYIHKRKDISYLCFFAGYMIRFIANKEKIDPDYLFAYTQLGVYSEWVTAIQRSAGQPNINAEEYKSLKIPIPPKEIQTQIVAKMDVAYATKKQKESEAQRLLDGIENYLLGELGIKLPEQKENTIQSRIFTRLLSEISGGRFDPKLYDKKTVSLKVSINNSSFPKNQLKHLIIGSIAGDWGNELDTEIDGFSKCLVIRATEFDNSFNLKLDNLRLKYRLISNKKLLKINVKDNDLLIEKSGGSPDQPVGRVAIITRDVLNQYSVIGYSNFVQKIRVNERYISPSYLFCFLKCIYNIGLTDVMQSQTNGIRNLIMTNYFDQSIPIPPLERQTEIADHITEIRSQAKQLQQQAKDGLVQAKKEVEAMILGTDENIGYPPGSTEN